MRVAIIPARGGSKRIPRKNCKQFLGKPLISYSIAAAIASCLFNEVMVSTDDEEIRDLALAAGARVPFLRSRGNADDYTPTAAVLKEVLQTYLDSDREFRVFCCLYPTAPLLEAATLIESHKKFETSSAMSMLAVCRYGHPTQRALQLKNNKVAFCDGESFGKRTQDLEPTFHDAGQFYWGQVAPFLAGEPLVGANSQAYELPAERVQDIDTITDWRLAELKYKLLAQEVV